MSISHDAVLAVGKWFETDELALEWLKQQDILSDDNLECINENGLEDSLRDLDLEGGFLNYYEGYGFYIGFSLDTDNLSGSYLKNKKSWDSMFSEESVVILEVKVW